MPMLRQAGLAAVAALLTAGATLAVAAPLNPGTPQHPRGIKLEMSFGWQGYSPENQPMVTGIDVWFPRGSVYNGARYPVCPVQTLNAFGPGRCPKGSIMGFGTGSATADTTITRPQITVVNGGANVVYFYTVLNNPARVQEPVVGHISRLHGNFIYHLSATIPQNLRIVAGVPIKLTYLDIRAGRGTWLATTGAPAGIKIQTTYDSGATTSYMVWVQNT